MKKITMALSVAALLMVGCSDKPKDQEKQTKTSQVTNEVNSTQSNSIYGSKPDRAQNANHNKVRLDSPHIGVITETVDGGGYTYAKVDDTNGMSYWIAGPQTAIAIGAKISYLEQMVMQDFTSKALKRTFDKLMFVSAIVPADKSAKTANQAPAKITKKDDVAHFMGKAHGSADKKPVAVKKVVKNASGDTIAGVYAKKDKLNGKSVTINAQVVKVSRAIMGKDWVHIQDGTGNSTTNDIIVTAKGSNVKVGDVVTATGKIKTKVDLGYGYKFEVIIEEGKFSAL